MMLRMVCPKCHHRFPVLGCCLKWSDETSQKKIEEEEEAKRKDEEDEGREEEEEEEEEEQEEEEEVVDDEEEEDVQREEEKEEKREKQKKAANTICSATTYYVSSLPVSRGYTSGSSCFIKPSTNIHERTIFQSCAVDYGPDVEIAGPDTMELFCDIQTSSVKQAHRPLLRAPVYQSNDRDPFIVVTENLNYDMAPAEQYVAATCELTGGNVTVATPDIQSGGCLMENTEADILVQASQIKIQPKLTGGGCLVQKKSSAENARSTTSRHTRNFAVVNNKAFPGNIRLSSRMIRDGENNEIASVGSRQQKVPMNKTSDRCDCKSTFQQNRCQNHRRLLDASLADNRDALPMDPIGNSVQFQVNATVQLPANLGQCTVNITATTTTPPKQGMAMKLPDRGRNNFHGGGIVQPNELDCATVNQIVAIGNSKDCSSVEQTEDASTIPGSWLMPTSWSLDSNDNRLREVKRMLQICGWYHEGISWQQSENLLKDASIGRWLMRDSSDIRYTFTVSVKTSRGPASIRVHYFLEQFRLDAEPKLALAMPFFDCPIKMLEHYVEYSKRMDEHRREVWVDYSGQLYSQIYLTKPLVKEVRSLSHLARLAVNRSKLPTEHLPLLIKNYIEEYPYTL
ncbi:PREDICTED: uncharacterized protein DDB_G0279979-like [Vollenhovia emeryi]|uniref:uncharacterized protein DDB_G0279979-like n=1 Tax=Vollenhovia emeryi TaxID=411798 RepID=UPI0005F4D259|nr:PREDICTED: uncharacterized protein DDB_G0279979-like [Vollenhovia emeryi]XP_011862504.1 PREDICTED: uncharacterized protein DDB_G0279979-like [Vollenhovia emeryi]XP_011862505.1 PREDICTED: uncharacterized protein DDB_G0279979-like [Vollenhovia emeryi]